MNTSNFTNYKPKDFSELLGVSVKRWDREETFQANGTPTNRRYCTYDQYLLNQVVLLRFCNVQGIIVEQCIEGYGNAVTIYQMK